MLTLRPQISEVARPDDGSAYEANPGEISIRSVSKRKSLTLTGTERHPEPQLHC